MPEQPQMPVLLVPGLVCDRALWEEQIESLEAANHPCLVADVTQHSDIEAMARAVLGAAPERFHLLGLSMGGYVALTMVRQAPGRMESLGLLDTSARSDSATQIARRREMIRRTEYGDFHGVVEELIGKFLAASSQADADLVARVRRMAHRVGGEVMIRQQHAIMSRPDRSEQLAAIDVPTLVVCGREDALVPLEHSEEIASGIPDAQLRIIEGSGHLPTMEHPAQVSEALISWLQRR